MREVGRTSCFNNINRKRRDLVLFAAVVDVCVDDCWKPAKTQNTQEVCYVDLVSSLARRPSVVTKDETRMCGLQQPSDLTTRVAASRHDMDELGLPITL